METDRRSFLKITGAAGAGLLAGNGASAETGDETPIDSPPAAFVTELFLDNEMLESTPGISRRLRPPKKHLLNPVVRCERWCDGNILQPYTTMYDEDEKLFKMWARCGSDANVGFIGGNAAFISYFTSKDGVNWERPDLGLFEVAGRRDHNIVFTSDLVPTSPTKHSYGPEHYVIPKTAMSPQGKKAFFWSVNRHPFPRDESEKYVALAIVQDHRRGAHIVTSPDGIRWSCATAPFWQTPHDVSGKGDDCLMHLTFDEAKRKWVIYRRIVPDFSEHLVATEEDTGHPGVDRYNRSYAYAESGDLKVWTNHQHILAMDPDDPADTELYQFACHNAGPAYVGFMSVFYLRSPQPVNVHLCTSRDGLRFTRVCRGEPFIRHGAEGYYDFMAMGCSQPKPVVVGDTVYYYYAALNFPHDAPIDADPSTLVSGAALATFKRDRYVSLETSHLDNGPCRIVTKTFTVTHPKLYINAATWDQGSIRVEALTREWQPIAGFTEAEARQVQGDALDHPVSWNAQADLGPLVGKEIRLKFYMTRARLHAMTMSKEDRPQGPVDSEFRYGERGDSAPKLT
ncbi:MAG: hypothetical protein IT366_09715 [Candidatus Hydrogenedentes bacterium]|nr:hypothetical protein [Candidatus Hydrogenedentota bacterium]